MNKQTALGCVPFFLALLLAGAGTAAADTLDTVLSAKQIDFATVEPLYRETVRRDGKIDSALLRLQAIAGDESRSKHQRASALLAASHLQWKFGLRPAAQESVAQALKLETNADLALQQARLLEAGGELQQAQRWYEQAFNLAAEPKRKEQIRLRMTFVAVGQQNIEALVRLAQKRDRDFRNRAAVALAVLNHYDEATGLYQVYGEGGDRFRQHLRLAQWALEAGDAPTAQDEAWKAVQDASLDRDRRYALSVLVDTHEMDNSMDKLLKRFERKSKLSKEEQDVRIDLLQKLGRYDEAIKLFNATESRDIDPASRRQLLRMYSDAGHTKEMVAEYRKLIAAETGQPIWSEGLSQYLIEQGDRPGALQVWKDYIQRNEKAGPLLAGAEAMERFGFDDLAVAATEKVLTSDPTASSEALLFRFELYMHRGSSAPAEQTLETMNRTLAPDSSNRVELADAYERIKKPQEALKVLIDLDRSRPAGLGVDERMRMAWLYDSTGQRDKALAVWKGLWNGQVNEAFRRLVEDRLVKLAAETGALGDLTVELESKLADGTATKKDSGLLVRIYSDTNDSASAVEVIREYFRLTGKDGKADLDSLREQANVYRALGRYGAFRKLTTRLVQLDPENKVDYLQSLVLNQLENGGEPDKAKTEQLKQWLSQLHGTGGAAAGAEFEAGILVLAGMEDQAIATYRSALAESPEHSDNYLLLADLLKKRSKEAEAIGALQYLVETADHDDAFMVGVDGILNMKPKDKGIIEWAQRRVLERLTSRDDKLYLYDLLGELAEGSGNTSMYFSAMENSLAYANSRRSNVLRELISASAEKSPMSMFMGGGSAGEPDPKRNLRYSRRLISLGEELPPEVYTDMGKIFLKMGDAENAADAFNRAVDRTGEASLVEETGDLFLKQGFNRQASAQYEKALIADADNFSVMRKLADVRVRQGADSDAQDLYLRAILDLLKSLPLEMEKVAQAAPPTLESTAGYPYKQNYWQLLTGFLYSLPSDEKRFAAIGQTFDEVLQESMRSVSGLSSKELAYYPRLNAFSRFSREVALRTGRYALADELDTKLLRYFGNDRELVSELVAQRRQWGLSASAVKLGVQARGAAAETLAASGFQSAPAASAGLQWALPSKAAATLALEQGEFRHAVNIALFNNDQALALSMYREWVKDSLQYNRKVNADPFGNLTSTLDILKEAQARLDAAGFASLSRSTFDMVRGRADMQRKLIAGGYGLMMDQDAEDDQESLLLAMEKAAGRQLVSSAELKDLVLGSEEPRGVLDLNYIVARLAPADQTAFFTRQLQSDEQHPLRIMGVLPTLRVILARPMSAQQTQLVLDVFKKGMQKQMATGGYQAIALGEQIQRAKLAKHMSPANMGAIEQLEGFLTTTYPKVFAPGFMRIDALRANGRESQALPLLVDVALHRFEAASHSAANSPMPFLDQRADAAIAGLIREQSDLIYPKNKAQMVALAQAKEKALGLTPPVFMLLWALEDCDPANAMEQKTQWLQGMAQSHPDSEPVLATLAKHYAVLGYADLQVQTLERLAGTVAPRKMDYKRPLFELWRQFDHPENAVRVAKGHLGELTAGPDAATRMMSMFGDPTLQPAIGKPMEQILALDKGGSAEQARLGLRSLLQQLPPAGINWMELRQMSGGDEDAQPFQYELLFNLDWHQPARDQAMNVNVGADGTMTVTGRMPLIESIAQDNTPPDMYSRTGKFLDKVATYEFSIDEFEAQIRTLQPQDIDSQYVLYGLLADAYEKHGRLQKELDALAQKVESGEAGGKERVLWLDLISRLPQAQAAAWLAKIEKAGNAQANAGIYEQMLIARVYARAGDGARAAELYSGAVLSSFDTSLEDYFGPRSPLKTVAGIYADAAQRLDAASLNRFTESVLRIVRPGGEVQSSGTYEQFIMWILSRAPDSQAARAQFQALINPQAKTDEWMPDAFIQAAEQYARLGQFDNALKMLKAALVSVMRPPALDMMNPFGSQRQRAIGQYRAALGGGVGNGFFIAQMLPQMALLGFKPLFPAEPKAWPDVKEWTQRAATQLAEWTRQDAIDRTLGLSLLALATLRESQMGANDAALASARNMSELMSRPQSVPLPAATLAMTVLEHIKAPLDAAVVRGLIEHRRLDARVLAPVIKRVADTDGAAQAAQLGDLALAYTQNDELLKLLKSLAAGRADLLQRVSEAEAKSAQARETLLRREEVALAAAGGDEPVEDSAEPGNGPAIGDTMELKFTAVDGRQVDLAQMKGKVVLVDFWATWCGPCRAELPNVKKVYESTHDKGFEIVGISLDRANDKEKLQEFVEKNGMPWPQHFDGKYWKNEFAVKNGVNAIPAAFLFDKDGKLVTKSARGQKLEDEVHRLLGISGEAAATP